MEKERGGRKEEERKWRIKGRRGEGRVVDDYLVVLYRVGS